jgi:hypothetical protein
LPNYRAYIVGIDGHFDFVRAEFLHNHADDATAIGRPNNSLMTTTLSFGTATDSWVDSPRKRSKATLRAALININVPYDLKISIGTAFSERSRGRRLFRYVRDPGKPAPGGRAPL